MDKKNIIIVILICCIVLLIILSFLINVTKKSSSFGTPKGRELLFSRMGVFSEKYDGDIETTEITQKLQEVVKLEIPGLYEKIKKMDENELKKYYNDEKKNIKETFGIQSEEEFITFANKISQAKIKLNTWHKIKINRDSFLEKSDKTNYAYVEFDVIYEKEEKMSFSMYVANRKLMSPQFIFIAK